MSEDKYVKEELATADAAFTAALERETSGGTLQSQNQGTYDIWQCAEVLRDPI